MIRSQNVLDLSFSFDGLVYINDEQSSKLKNVEIESGDVLLNITGDSVARSCMVAESVLPARVNQHVAIIRGNKIKVLNHFILYFLQYKKKHLLSLSQGGATRNALTKKMIEDFDIQLPGLSEQKRIISILKSFDDKIENNRKINENLEQQAQALFKSWFVDFEPFRDQPFVDSELGPIPQGWKVGKLKDIAAVTMGASPSGTSYNTNGVGDVFYQGRAEFGFRFPNRNKYTTEPIRFAEPNSVLLSVRAPVGDINIAEEKCCIGRGLASVKSKDGNNSFLLYLMFSLNKHFQQYNAEGTVFGCINKDSLNDMPILLPKESIIDAFESIASSFDEQIRAFEIEIKKLHESRDLLLPKLMSGEIKV